MVRVSGLGRALTEVLRAAPADGRGRASLFGSVQVSDAVEARLAKATGVLAATFPDDVVASRYLPGDSGPVCAIRAPDGIAADAAFRIGALFDCTGDELEVNDLEVMGARCALLLWRPHGVLTDDDRAVVDAVAALTAT